MLHHLSLIITFPRSGLWLQLATELLGEEGEQFLRAYSAGLQVLAYHSLFCLGQELKGDGKFHILLDQEWVEALSFYHFLATGTVVTYSQVNSIVVGRLSQPLYISGEG